MKIVRLSAENVKRVKVVEVVPKKSDSLVVVGGPNDAGKSSLLDSIEMALGGKGTHPKEPLRRGAKKGRVVLDLGDIVVTRTFAAGGATQLTVESKAGKAFSSPQAMLDKLYGELTFDPLSFERQKPDDQAAILKRLVGLDFAALDKTRQEFYDERTQENRTLKALEVSVQALERYEDAPEAEVSVQALSAELEAAEALARLALQASADAGEARSMASAAWQAVESADADVQRLETQLLAARRRSEEAKVAADAAETRASEALAAKAEAEAKVPDTTAVHERLKAAEGLNEKVRHNRKAAEQEQMLADQKAVVAELNQKIDAIDEEKARQLSEAQYPVPGLSIDAEGLVRFNGLPFEQASTSDRIRVSVAMGLALHPKLRILLVRDGSLIGEAKWKLIEEMVKDADAQLWVEMMQEEPSARTTVFIEDGLAKAVKAPKT